MKVSNRSRIIMAIILLLFALLTLFLSSSVIFDWFGIRTKEGNYVLFIVWANFIASLLYLIAVYGFIKKLGKTHLVITAALGILILAFIGLLFHINNGGMYETKTIKAMAFRIAVTLIFTLYAYYSLKKPKV